MGYKIEIVTPAASECVSVSDLKTHLRINGTQEDTELGKIITCARMQFENLTQRIVLPTTFRQWFYQLTGPITLYRGIVSSITYVKYYDANDTLQTLTGTDSDIVGIPATVFTTNGSYPNTSLAKKPTGYVQYVCGWASSGAVPYDVSTAIMLQAAYLYEYCRQSYSEKVMAEMPMGFRAICNQYRSGIIGEM